MHVSVTTKVIGRSVAPQVRQAPPRRLESPRTGGLAKVEVMA
jgi:hypothetical protein